MSTAYIDNLKGSRVYTLTRKGDKHMQADEAAQVTRHIQAMIHRYPQSLHYQALTIAIEALQWLVARRKTSPAFKNIYMESEQPKTP